MFVPVGVQPGFRLVNAIDIIAQSDDWKTSSYNYRYRKKLMNEGA